MIRLLPSYLNLTIQFTNMIQTIL